MRKNIVVVFTSNNARILVNPDVSKIKPGPNVLVNPDLSAVKRVPPHFWKLENGQVREMTPDEKADRIVDHVANDVDNQVPLIQSAQLVSAHDEPHANQTSRLPRIIQMDIPVWLSLIFALSAFLLGTLLTGGICI